jgi:Flp pilus assembly pilin Flp
MQMQLIGQMLMSLIREEEGQDLIEYTLLLAFVALASAALFIGAGNSINSIWTIANGILANAATSAS